MIVWLSRISTERLATPRSVACLSLLLLLSVLGVVMFFTLRSPLKDDIAWLLYVARRWLDGRELYVDVVEVNPPLIVWISAVPAEVARLLGFGPKFVVVPMFAAAVLACAWWTSWLLAPRGGIFARRLPVFATIGINLLFLPAADLGQREHLMTAAFLPYLVLFAGAMDAQPTRIGTSMAAGVLAGLGCALKPQYAAAFAVLECLAFTRGLRLWRILPLVAAMTLAGYAGLVWVVCPAYLRQAVPLAMALYGATNVTLFTLLDDSFVVLGGEVVAISLLWLRRRGTSNFYLMQTLVVFAVMSTIICFVDGKDWYYHRLPATITTVLALLVLIATGLMQPRQTPRWALAGAALAVAVFAAASVRQWEPEALDAIERKQTVIDRLEEILRAEHARTYIAFSEWIALGFPVVNETGVAWASRFDSMWALKGQLWRATFDSATNKEWPVARWVAHDFIAGCPDVAVVDTRQTTNYIKVLRAADTAFAQAWSGYRPIAAFNGLVVYRRVKATCSDGWVALEPKRVTSASSKSRLWHDLR